MKEKIYALIPLFFQNLLISLYNIKAYKVRYGGSYKHYRKLFFNNRKLTRKELEEVQRIKYANFINNSIDNTEYYKNKFKDISSPEKLDNILSLPILTKEDLRNNIKEIGIKSTESLIISMTGGTTGKSLMVKYRPDNSQERFAMLDDFRSRFGYELGEKTAWFSGKNLLTPSDIRKNRFWKTDYFYKVRYYSTFHIKDDYLAYYIKNLMEFKPKYFVGFPSTILEIAKYGLKNNIDFPANIVLAVFPTAETITLEMTEVIEKFFKTKMYNQYASSEGAPFIFQCTEGKLHLELQSGVFEVLDENNRHSKSGRLVVTSFTTEATPLIRYDIGDSITLDDETVQCNCGNNNPLVVEILGRIDDFVYSPEMGKINLGNVSNTLKDVVGIKRFQVEQNDLNKIVMHIIVDKEKYSMASEKKFRQNWINRIGENMELTFDYVDEIEVEKSGKFRMVKNNIKHLLQ